ncbi:SPOR domain-containing protein [Albidovulum sp.]|uniref:SPOR domain-containing protein n=1 Tax=Albidovulum sp. TaxID=1872424 RepID=UPI0039B93162
MTFQGQAWLGVACALALSGCVAGTGPDAAGDEPATPGAAFSPVSVERDVEAPQVFSLAGQGLWDGRPSLGGVWVAHSSVTDPERVIIRNPKNGKSVVGALFRRERDMPGPGLQVSSDAAEALGMLAGQPAELGVVALRREERPVPADAEIGAEDMATDVATTDAATTAAAPGDAGPATETETETATATAGTTAAAGGEAVPETVGAEAAAAAPAAAVAAEAAPRKKTGGLFGFLRKKPAAVDTAAAPIAPGAGAGAIDQTTLDPVTASAAAAIDRAEANTDASTGASTGASTAAPKPSVAAAPAPAAIKRGYIQIGIFSQEANAKRAADQMTAAGMGAAVRPDQSNGKTYWRVIVGPAASVAERDALVARVKGIGYPDAYPVSN